MLEWSSTQIAEWISQFLWPFFRVGAFFMTVPIIGTQLVPMRVRLILALVVTLCCLGFVPPMPNVDALSFAAYLVVGQQILIGIAMAFVLQLLMQVFVVIGQMVAMQMGLGFASMVDPVNGVSVAVLSQFYLMLAMLLFLAMGGHLVMMEVLVESFRVMPVAVGLPDASLFGQLAQWGSWMFLAAMVVALPAVTALLIVNFAFGVMNRAAPQLNIFSLGFPFTMLFGLLIVWVTVKGFVPQFQNLSSEALTMMRQLIGL